MKQLSLYLRQLLTDPLHVNNISFKFSCQLFSSLILLVSRVGLFDRIDLIEIFEHFKLAWGTEFRLGIKLEVQILHTLILENALLINKKPNGPLLEMSDFGRILLTEFSWTQHPHVHLLVFGLVDRMEFSIASCVFLGLFCWVV